MYIQYNNFLCKTFTYKRSRVYLNSLDQNNFSLWMYKLFSFYYYCTTIGNIFHIAAANSLWTFQIETMAKRIWFLGLTKIFVFTLLHPLWYEHLFQKYYYFFCWCLDSGYGKYWRKQKKCLYSKNHKSFNIKWPLWRGTKRQTIK